MAYYHFLLWFFGVFWLYVLFLLEIYSNHIFQDSHKVIQEFNFRKLINFFNFRKCKRFLNALDSLLCHFRQRQNDYLENCQHHIKQQYTTSPNKAKQKTKYLLFTPSKKVCTIPHNNIIDIIWDSNKLTQLLLPH